MQLVGASSLARLRASGIAGQVAGGLCRGVNRGEGREIREREVRERRVNKFEFKFSPKF